MNKKMVSKKNSKQRNQTLWIIALALIIIIGAFFVINQKTPVTTAPMGLEISVEETHDYYLSQGYILDVRQPEEYESGHIPGSTLIPLGELPDRLDELQGDEPIVVVCRSGNRSATGRDILRDAGFNDVTSMAGGMNCWIQLGFEINKGPEK